MLVDISDIRKDLNEEEKEKEFFVDEANRAKKRFWLIYGDGDGKYNQYDRVTLLGDDSRTEMSWEILSDLLTLLVEDSNCLIVLLMLKEM